ncbi:MAG: hypothetical protein QGH76_00220 [Phycisphaerales bacterium]|nr:hypothetical protein [Phycisphaerales bacterium]
MLDTHRFGSKKVDLRPDEVGVRDCLDGDGMVAVEDMLIIISQWGPCVDDCTADTDGNGSVDLDDLLRVLSEFGPC